eukprot:7037396-Prymnesium_polylepis.1
MALFDESDEGWDDSASDGDVDLWDEQALGQFTSQLGVLPAGAAGGLGANLFDELRSVSPLGDKPADDTARAPCRRGRGPLDPCRSSERPLALPLAGTPRRRRRRPRRPSGLWELGWPAAAHPGLAFAAGHDRSSGRSRGLLGPASHGAPGRVAVEWCSAPAWGHSIVAGAAPAAPCSAA